MENRYRAVLAALCLAAIVASVLASAPSASGDEEVEVVFDFSPQKASYIPGEEFSINFTVRNVLVNMSESGYPNDIKVTALQAHFSWLAPNEWVTENISAASDWLFPGELHTYRLNASVPENLTAGTYSYLLKVEYTWRNVWGESEPAPWTSITYRDFVVSSESVDDGVPTGPDYLAATIAGIAIVLAVGAIGAVLYFRSDERRRRETTARTNGIEAVAASEAATASTSYPIITAAPGEQFPVERGFLYLVKEKRPAVAFGMFNEAVNHGSKGMLVVREHPNRLKQMHEFQATKILWLTRRAGVSHIDPTHLSLLNLEITKFVEGNPRSVILLEGLEYVITQNDFEAVLRFVNHLHDFVLTHDCAVIVVIDPRVLSTRELALLERAAKIVEPAEHFEPRNGRISEELEA